MRDRRTGRVLLRTVEETETAWERCIGLLGRTGMAADGGLLLRHCSSIHMAFMRFPIDAVFLDWEMTVTKVVERLRPWRVSFGFGAAHVLELSAGTAREIGLERGMGLECVPANLAGECR